MVKKKKKKQEKLMLTLLQLELVPSFGPFTQKHEFSMTFFNEIFDNIAAQEFTALFPCEIFGSFLALAVHAARRNRDCSGAMERPGASSPDAWPLLPTEAEALKHLIFLSPLPGQLCSERWQEDVPSSMGLCVRGCVWRQILFLSKGSTRKERE